MKKLKIRDHVFRAIMLCAISTTAQNKITLSPNNIIPIYGHADQVGIQGILDEQVLANNPIVNGQGGNVQTEYKPIVSAMNIHYPYYKIVIDLGTNFSVSNISIYDGSNSDSLWIKSGNPINFQPLISMITNQYNTWRNYPVATNTRYLEITSKSAASIIKEIVVYGSQTGTTTPIPTITPHNKPLIQDFMGTNGLHIDNVNYSKCVGFVREYHNAQWDEGNMSTTYPGYPNNQYAWNPSWVSGSGWAWNFDNYYSAMKSNNIETMPCLQGSAPYIQNFNFSNLQHKPTTLSENSYLPASYTEHGDYLYQYVARYGANNVPSSNLKLLNTNQPVSGLNKISWIENWNEPNKDWQGTRGYFNAYQYAAMSSADYDGHLGSLGNTIGAKNASPNIKFAMSGIISLNLDYVKALKFWCDHYRNGDFMFDAINFHHYSNDAGGQGSGSPTTGISPEQDSLYSKAKKIVTYRDQYLPGVEVWVSEFGYDTHPASVQRAPAIGTNDAQEVQGQWLIRSFLALSAAGVDKAMQFMLSDNNGTSGGVYASSGLLYYPGGGNVYTPKKSWYYVYTMKNALTNYKFDAIVSGGNSSVWIYKFANNNDPNKFIYAVWSPTSNNTIVNNFSLNLGSQTASTCNQILLSPTSTVGISTILPVNSNNVSLTVNERPQFIEVTYTGTNSLPVASFTTDATKCVGTAIAFSDASANSPTSWAWSFPGSTTPTSTLQNPSVTYTAGGTYTVTLVSANGSGTSTPVTSTISVSANPTVAASSATVCRGSAASLTASGATTYSWNTGATTASISVTPTITTNYTVTGTNASGCTNTKTVAVTVNTAPTVAASNATVCTGTSANLTASGATTYSWNTGATTASVSVTPTITTNYTLIGTNTLGCSNTITLTVIVNPLPVVMMGTVSSTLCLANAPVTLLGTPSGGTFSGTGVVANTFDPSVSGQGTFSLQYDYTDANGCSSVDTKTVNVSLCTGITELTSTNISIYPNPTRDAINVMMDASIINNTTIELYDATGKLVITEKVVNLLTTIKIDSLAKGIYTVRILSEGKQVSRRIIKE